MALYFTAVCFSNFWGIGILHTLSKNSLTLPPPGPLSMWVMSTDCHVRGNQILKYLFPNSFKRAITNLLHINISHTFGKASIFSKTKEFFEKNGSVLQCHKTMSRSIKDSWSFAVVSASSPFWYGVIEEFLENSTVLYMNQGTTVKERGK